MKKGWDKSKVTLGDFADDLYLIRHAIKNVEIVLLFLFGTTFYLVGCYLHQENPFLFLLCGGLFVVVSLYALLIRKDKEKEEILARWK